MSLHVHWSSHAQDAHRSTAQNQEINVSEFHEKNSLSHKARCHAGQRPSQAASTARKIDRVPSEEIALSERESLEHVRVGTQGPSKYFRERRPWTFQIIYGAECRDYSNKT